MSKSKDIRNSLKDGPTHPPTNEHKKNIVVSIKNIATKVIVQLASKLRLATSPKGMKSDNVGNVLKQ